MSLALDSPWRQAKDMPGRGCLRYIIEEGRSVFTMGGVISCAEVLDQTKRKQAEHERSPFLASCCRLSETSCLIGTGIIIRVVLLPRPLCCGGLCPGTVSQRAPSLRCTHLGKNGKAKRGGCTHLCACPGFQAAGSLGESVKAGPRCS